MHDTPALPPRQTSDGSRSAAFADLIVTARRARGWTQDALAFRAGVSLRTVTRWEAGKAERPDPDSVRSVCAKLGIDHKQALVALGYLTTDDLTPAA